MLIVAVDPGTTESAYVVYDTDKGEPVQSAKILNQDLIDKINFDSDFIASDHCVIEMLKSYGNAMGDSCLMTCVWVGRFIEAWHQEYTLIPRATIKTNVCGHPRAKDSNVRQALIDLYGGKDKAVGKKKTPGVLYGFKADMWAALAVAITYADLYHMSDSEDFLQ